MEEHIHDLAPPPSQARRVPRRRSTALSDLIARAVARRRISYGDLRRLERDVLPAGPTSREDVEALVGLDLALARADPEWPAFLASAIREFAVGSGRIVDQDTAEWLVGGPLHERTRTGLAIARAIVAEARKVDEALVAFVEGFRAKARSARSAPTADVDEAPPPAPVVEP